MADLLSKNAEHGARSDASSSVKDLDSSSAVYQKLNFQLREIRLLHLISGEFQQEDVRITVTVVSLDDAPVYDPISYTWESEGPKRTISVQNQPFSVTNNQYMALRRLRYPATDRIVWMDCISINQNDIEETEQQVSIMGDIFANGNATQVWLGELDETWRKNRESLTILFDNESTSSQSETGSTALIFMSRHRVCQWSQKAAAMIKDMASKINKYEGERFVDLLFNTVFRLKHSNHLIDPMPVGIEGKLMLDLKQPHGPYKEVAARSSDSMIDALAGLKTILNAPWWGRVWIMQEVLLSSKTPVVYFHSTKVPFNFFINIWQSHLLHLPIPGRVCVFDFLEISSYHEELLELFNDFQQTHHSDPLSLALHSFRCNTSLLQDRVYGIAGLLAPHVRPSVDYNTDGRTLCNDFCWRLIDLEQNLHLLSFASVLPNSMRTNQRSWALADNRRSDVKRRFKTPVYDSKSIARFNSVEFDPSEQVLRLSGSETDKVAVNGCEASDTIGHVEWMNLWASYAKARMLMWDQDILLRTIFWNSRPKGAEWDLDIRLLSRGHNTASQRVEPANRGHSKIREKHLTLLRFWMQHNPHDGKSLDFRDITEYFYGLAPSKSRSVFIPAAGRLGVGPADTRAGDAIFRVAGCGYALMLRQILESEEHPGHAKYPDHKKFRLVGPCYIYGFEEMVKDEPKDEIEFILY